MGWFSKKHDKERWKKWIPTLLTSLAMERLGWAQDCLSKLQVDELSDSAAAEFDNCLVACQLYAVAALLAVKQYVPPNQGENFMSLLVLKAASVEHIDSVQTHFSRLAGTDNPVLAFAGDVSTALTGSPDAVRMTKVGSMMESLVTATQAAAARDFGDPDTAGEILKSYLAGRDESTSQGATAPQGERGETSLTPEEQAAYGSLNDEERDAFDLLTGRAIRMAMEEFEAEGSLHDVAENVSGEVRSKLIDMRYRVIRGQLIEALVRQQGSEHELTRQIAKGILGKWVV